MTDILIGPRYHKDVNFHKHTDRTVGWLELFYDLVYVATLIQIGNFLSSNLTLIGFGQFLVMMFIIWWAWTGEMLYQNRYYVDDLIHRLLVFMQIGGVALIGISVSKAFGALSTQFALGYVIVRCIMVLMYIRAYFTHPESRTFSISYMIGFCGGIIIWVVSMFTPINYQWIAWLVAIVFEVTFFFSPSSMQESLNWSPDDHHLVERFGIFTIIVLGEAFVKVLDDSQGTALGIPQVIFGTASLVILYSLWWLYFSDAAGELYDAKLNRKLLSWANGHLFLATALVGFGVAVKKIFAKTIKSYDKELNEEYRLLLTTVIVIYLIALTFINYGIDEELSSNTHKKREIVYIIFSIIILVLGFSITGLTGIQFTSIIAFLMGLLVVFNTFQMITGNKGQE